MIRVIIVMVPIVFLINGLTKHDWLEALLFAVAVAVGLTPEMLPMIVTVNLAKGAIDMSRARVIVKRLNAIQNFGAMNILCTDKTGTLTQDRIILKRYLDIRGEESERVLQYAYLNSHFQSGLKNLLDIAVLQHVEMHGILGIDKGFAKIDEIPFDFSRRRLSVVVAHGRTSTSSYARGRSRKFSQSARATRSTERRAGSMKATLQPQRKRRSHSIRTVSASWPWPTRSSTPRKPYIRPPTSAT